MQDKEKIVIQIIQDTVGSDRTPKIVDSLKDDLNFDSLDKVEFIMKVEEVFRIEITDGEADKIDTVQDVVDIIGRKSKKFPE